MNRLGFDDAKPPSRDSDGQRRKRPLPIGEFQPPTRFEHSRQLPSQAFTNSPERCAPVITFHFAPVQRIGSRGNFVEPGLRNLFAGFTCLKAVNQVSNQGGSIVCGQQQNLLPQLFQCHRCTFRGVLSWPEGLHFALAGRTKSTHSIFEARREKPGTQVLIAFRHQRIVHVLRN